MTRLHPWLALLTLLAALGCKGNKQAATPTAPAQVTELAGLIEVDRGGQVTPAHAGSELQFGDLVRTGDGASARVRFASGQSLRLGERTLLRLGRDVNSSAQISVALGEAEIEGAGDVSVVTPRGPARLDQGGRLRVRVDDRRSRFEVMVGRASFGDVDDPDGGTSPLALGSGEGLAIAIGGAVIERYRVRVGTVEFEPTPAAPAVDAKQPLPAPESEGAAAGADALPAAEAITAAEAGPPAAPLPEPSSTRLTAPAPDASARAFDLNLSAGENAFVHTERTPVSVRLRLPPGCAASSARLRLTAPRTRIGQPDGPIHMLVELPRGVHRYRLYCTPHDQKDTARGTITVRRDSGAAPLPRRPPHNRLDADGRRYTVLFQNHLPAFALSWPRLIGRAPYTLVIESRGQIRKFTARRPTQQLRAGALAEGHHTFYWISANGHRSPTTTLALRFDNAALAAEIQLPRPGAAYLAGDPARIDVKGLTLPGSRVSVNEGPLPVDTQGRFRAELVVGTPPPRTLAIRVDHPRTGTHHYLRKLRVR